MGGIVVARVAIAAGMIVVLVAVAVLVLALDLEEKRSSYRASLDNVGERTEALPMLAHELSRLLLEMLYLVLLLSAPVLGVSLVVGLGVAFLQAITQIQELTLTFVPKLVGVALALALAGGWMAGELLRFTATLWSSIPRLVP